MTTTVEIPGRTEEKPMDIKEGIESYLGALHGTLDALDRNEIAAFADALLDAYHRGATIFVCGNGGSAGTASHFACDLNKGVAFGLDRRFRVMPLNDNIPTVMAYANDVGYDSVFIEQLRNFIQAGDMVVGFSGSGNSPNVLRAIEYANNLGALTVGITGYDGGRLREAAKMSVNANVRDMQLSEDIHVVLCHMIMRLLNTALHGDCGQQCG
jgi:D-sedoheptulose 7-phosphate isomerase